MVVFSCFISLIGILSGMISFTKMYKHILVSLLSLEFIVLNIYWFMLSSMSFMGGELYFTMFFLTLCACEGALGLGLVVLISRSHSGDNFKMLNVTQC